MDRRRFVRQAGMVGAAAGAIRAVGAQDGAVRIPTEVDIEPSWLTWVTAANGCLRGLGADCDNVEVAGLSGYAFHMCIPPEVSVAGPTILPWEDLAAGCRRLGRATAELRGDLWTEEPDPKEVNREALSLARREVDAGRPCVLWGLGLPEFGIVVGYDGEEYVYRWSGDPGNDLRCRYDGLDNPGGMYLLAFPAGAPRAPGHMADRSAVGNALRFLKRPTWMGDHHFGLAAYGPWIAELEAGRANAFGNSYCAQCYRDAKSYSRDFVRRVAERNEPAAGPLDAAIIAYEECADAMGIVAQLFPFPGAQDETVEDPIAIADATEALTTARDAEVRAATAMEESLQVEWSGA